jgi:hypothetical protein
MGTTTKRLAPEDAALSLRLAEASANPSLADTLELVHLSSEDVGHAGASYQACCCDLASSVMSDAAKKVPGRRRADSLFQAVGRWA